MRLWHEKLIQILPRQQLQGQHRECCALRGLGWGKRHNVVDYVFTHDRSKLFQYHTLVMDEMERRGYKPDCLWRNPNYRGKRCDADIGCTNTQENVGVIYREHDDEYLNECICNLKCKGILLNYETNEGEKYVASYRTSK